MAYSKTTWQDGVTPVDAAHLNNTETGIIEARLDADSIKGTTQTVVLNTDKTVQKIQHKDGSNNLIREDVFTYTTNLITEVRTLSTGETLTLKYHTDTLQTEVI